LDCNYNKLSLRKGTEIRLIKGSYIYKLTAPIAGENYILYVKIYINTCDPHDTPRPDRLADPEDL